LHAAGHPRLAERDDRERRRRGHRHPAQGGVAGAAALPGQPVPEPGAARRRPRRPARGDGVPDRQRSDRQQPGPGRPSRHRPGARRVRAPRRTRAAARVSPDRAL
ncbi:MAG: hypothetical protein AVDCRST_MAG30-3711, partial [uncultured Solirubrobacteraceae bacterium]